MKVINVEYLRDRLLAAKPWATVLISIRDGEKEYVGIIDTVDDDMLGVVRLNGSLEEVVDYAAEEKMLAKLRDVTNSEIRA